MAFSQFLGGLRGNLAGYHIPCSFLGQAIILGSSLQHGVLILRGVCNAG